MLHMLQTICYTCYIMLHDVWQCSLSHDAMGSGMMRVAY
jgi:hypothetical protein